jgi:hypothetical protein
MGTTQVRDLQYNESMSTKPASMEPVVFTPQTVLWGDAQGAGDLREAARAVGG